MHHRTFGALGWRVSEIGAGAVSTVIPGVRPGVRPVRQAELAAVAWREDLRNEGGAVSADQPA